MVRMGYCFVVVRGSAVKVGSCNLVVGVRSGSILVRSGTIPTSKFTLSCVGSSAS